MTDNKLLVLHDHTCGIRLENGQLNGSVATVRILENCHTFSGTTPDVIHVVAHTSDFNRISMTNAFFSGNASGKQVIVLHVASGGFVQHVCENTNHSDANFVWLSQKDTHLAYRKVSEWLPEFMKLDFKTAEDLARIANESDHGQASAYETDYAHLLDIILPGRIENRLAFRLLCEAYKCKRIDNKNDCEGIEIHAPEGIGQWLAPFGKVEGGDDAAKAKAIDEVAGMIGSGEVKKRAKAVLEAGNGTGDLKKAIGEFLNPEEEGADQP